MTGLIVEGGASRTYFAVGVMDALLEENIYFDYIGGASAGIANAVSYASKQIGRNIKIGLEYLPLKEYLGKRHMFNPKNRSLYNIDFVFNEIPNKHVPFDYEEFRKYPGIIEAAVTNVKTGKCEYIPITEPEKSWNLIVASCSLPLVFPMVKINGNKYLDGGISDAVPFKRAIECGCNKNIVILSRERSYLKSSGGGEKISSLAFFRYPEFAAALKNRSNMYNSQRKELFELEKEGKVMIIAPQDTTGWQRLENNPDKIREFYEKGYNMAKDRMNEIKKYIEE